MQSFQKFHFIPDPGYHCYHCPPSNTGSPDCLRQLILVKRGNQPSLYPFLEDLSQLSDTSKYSHHHCAQDFSAEAHPARKIFSLCAHYAKLSTLLSKLARSADLKEAITLSGVYNTQSLKKLQGNPSLAGINNLSPPNPANAQTFDKLKMF